MHPTAAPAGRYVYRNANPARPKPQRGDMCILKKNCPKFSKDEIWTVFNIGGTSGVAKNHLGNHQSAIADFDKAIELGLNSFEVYCHRAFAKTALDKYDAAVSDYDKAIELNQDLVEIYEVYNILGILRSELGQYNEALADYAEAIRIKPDYAEAHANSGVAKVKLDRIDEAKSDFQMALELAEQRNNADLKVFVENQLQQLNQAASKQNNKKPRRGGQWKGKVKIAEDFDELPESFVTVTSEEDE